MLALQLASQQFSPRLLRQLARDPVTRRVLSVLAGTFVFTTAAMSGVDEDRAVPTVAVVVGLAMGVCSFGALLAYITHMVRALRVDTLMVSVHNDADRAIEVFYPPYDDRPHKPEELPLEVAEGCTLDQDVGFGFRQLEDIAVRAMSPSTNDPVTAAHAVGHMADLLVSLTGRHLGPTLHPDSSGERRVIVPDRDMRYYLDLMCGQLRRFSASEPSVLNALLRALRDVAVSCRDDEQRREIRRAADEVLESMDPSVPAFDVASVVDHHTRVVHALDGEVALAFGDRAGETRSM